MNIRLKWKYPVAIDGDFSQIVHIGPGLIVEKDVKTSKYDEFGQTYEEVELKRVPVYSIRINPNRILDVLVCEENAKLADQWVKDKMFEFVDPIEEKTMRDLLKPVKKEG